jgi:hypothetical protein
MFIDANKILELIEVAKDCERKLPEAEQWIHVRDIAGTLQKLIDDEVARLDKMSDEWHDEEWVEINLEETEPTDDGLFELVEVANRRVDFDWPYGV